jgi:uncharacterized membrane protein YvbJ
MKTCAKCGCMCDDNEKFCHNCGNEFVTGQPLNNFNNQNNFNNPYGNPYNAQPVDNGTTVGGFVLGFLLGLIGLIIALVVGKPDTKKGAGWGFLVQFILGIVLISSGYNI